MQNLLDFVNDGGTLVAFNNASMFAINQFKLPVTNALAGLSAAQFFCSGALLKVHVEDTKNPLTAGLLPDTTVMFERGPAFDTRPELRGRCWRARISYRSPLESGYLSGPDRIQGKAAAIDATYGKGRLFCWDSSRSGAGSPTRRTSSF